MNWHQDPEWLRYVRQVFLMVGRVTDYEVRYTEEKDKCGIASVDPINKVLRLRTTLLSIPEQPLLPLRFGGSFLLVLRGIVAHEGSHVAFSERKPQNETAWLWNALEDERIEREAVRRFPELMQDFALIGDLLLHDSLYKSNGKPFDLKNACLVWRFAHDRPDVPFHVTDPARWAQIRPLVEESWDAEKEEVKDLARRIWDMLTQEEQQSEPVQNVSASGAGAADADTQNEPTDDATPKNDDTVPDNENEPDKDEGTADQGQDDQQQGGQSGADQEQEEGSGPQSAAPSELPQSKSLPQAPPLPGEQSDQKPNRAKEGGADTKGGLVRGAVQTPEEYRLSLVREIAELLAPKETPGKRVRSRSTGRYDFQRRRAGHEKYFRKRGKPTRPTPFYMRLLIDLSASMAGKRLSAAKDLAQLLLDAGKEARSDVETWGFNNEAFLIAETKTPDGKHKLASVGVGFGTRLGAALEEVFYSTVNMAGKKEIVVILSDGDLNGEDRERCLRLLQHHEKRVIIPLLIDGNKSQESIWANLFGDAQAITIHTLIPFLRNYLKELRHQEQR